MVREIRASRESRDVQPPPIIAGCPKNVPTSGGTSSKSPAEVGITVGRRGFPMSPIGGTARRDESTRKPSSTSVARCGQARRAERPFRGAVGRDGRSSGVLERRARRAQVGPELVDGQLVRAPVKVAVAADLVSRFGDPPDEVRVPAGHPAEDEERGAGAALIEQCEDSLRGRDDAGGERVPALRAVVRRVAADVEPLLHVDGQDKPGYGHGGEL